MGYAIGNQIEIEETIECLHGNIQPDIQELVTKYGGYLLQRIKKVRTMTEGADLILQSMKNGQALEKFYQMIIGQGVDKQLAYELCYKRNYDLVFGKKSLYTSSISSEKSGKNKILIKYYNLFTKIMIF